MDKIKQGLSTLGAKSCCCICETFVLELGLYQRTELTNIPAFMELIWGDSAGRDKQYRDWGIESASRQVAGLSKLVR